MKPPPIFVTTDGGSALVNGYSAGDFVLSVCSEAHRVPAGWWISVECLDDLLALCEHRKIRVIRRAKRGGGR